MTEPRSPRAPGYSTDRTPSASIFALAEPDFTPEPGPTRTRWAVTDTGEIVETPATRLRRYAA